MYKKNKRIDSNIRLQLKNSYENEYDEIYNKDRLCLLGD